MLLGDSHPGAMALMAKKEGKKKGPCPPDASSHPRLHLASAELNLTRTGCGFFKVFQKSAEERRGFLF